MQLFIMGFSRPLYFYNNFVINLIVGEISKIQFFYGTDYIFNDVGNHMQLIFLIIMEQDSFSMETLVEILFLLMLE